MLHMIKVSIIIPSLNRVEFMEECLSSASMQSLVDIEIICIDAGSTDGTLDVIKRYLKKDGRFTLINSDKRSYGYQINVAIRRAKGQYITILETDDYLLPNACSYMYENASSMNVDFFRAGVDLFIGKKENYLTYGQLRRIPDQYTNRKFEGYDNFKAKLLCVVSILGTLYRRDFLLNNEILANESSGASFQDVGFCLQVSSKAMTFAYSNESVYKRRMDNETSSIHSVKSNLVSISEYSFVKSLIEINKVSMELYSHQIIPDYYWRLTISDEKEREEFISIHKEMEDIKNYNFNISLNNDEKRKLDCLLGNLDEFHKMKRLQELSQKAYGELYFSENEFIVVSAGKLATHAVLLQDYWNTRNIKAICDNSDEKYHKAIGEYTIISVYEAVKLYPSIKYVIINQKNYEELQKQLEDFGISADRISIITCAPDMEKIALYKV